jgi:hypothetical protein
VNRKVGRTLGEPMDMRDLDEGWRLFYASHEKTIVEVEQRPGLVPILTVRYDCAAGGCDHPMCGGLYRQMGMNEEDVRRAREAGLIR